MEKNTMIRSRVGLEPCDGVDLTFDCLVNPNNEFWNGWVNPYLNRKDSERLLKIAREYFPDDGFDSVPLKDIEVLIDDELYYFFGCCWCWSYVEETFEYDTIIVIDRTEVNLKGYDYYRKDDHYYLSRYDLPKLKESISASLYELALDGQGTLIFNDEDFLESNGIYALLSEYFNYRIDFGSMSKKELKAFIQDLLDGETEYFLNDDFPKEVLITFLRERP